MSFWIPCLDFLFCHMDCVCEKPGSMAGMYKGSMTMSLGSVPSLGCFVVPGVHERPIHS